MELLLLELLLTMVLSVLVTFLLRKVAAVGAADEGCRDAGGAAEPLVSGATPNSTDEAKEGIGRGVTTGSAEEEKVLMTDEAGCAEKVAPTDPPCPDEEKEIAEEWDTSEQRLIGDEVDDVKIGMPAEDRSESQDGGPSISISSDTVRLSVSDDGEWEGIEKSDLGKLFASATAFVAGEEGGEALAKLGNDMQMQLYGLYKIATEGPCYESQPMSLNLSARTKWHSWRRLGYMDPEMAMERYIALVSENIPGWMPLKKSVCIKDDDDSFGVASSSFQMEDELSRKSGRNAESHSSSEECSKPTGLKGSEQGEEASSSA